MSKVYYQGETIRQDVEVSDQKGILIDADTIVITIIDPEETMQIDEQGMIHDAKGKYYYNYLIGTDAKRGKWATEIKAVKGFTAIEQDEFTVLEAIG